MGWVAGGVWIGAVAFAAVVLAFCAYELHWKSQRLRSDLDRLSALSQTLTGLQADVAATQQRLSDASS